MCIGAGLALSLEESIAIAWQHAPLVNGAESPDLQAINPVTPAINLSEKECAITGLRSSY